MSILSKPKTADNWKNKYFDLLGENEALEKSNQHKEEVLCKTITRLSIATLGVNKDLDPYLERIRDQLKKGLKTEQLKSELESFSNALMTMEKLKPEDDLPECSTLFDFLYNRFPEQKNVLGQIKSNFLQKKYSDQDSLFIAINELIDPAKQTEALTTADLNTLQINSIDTESVLTHLQQLIESTEIPTQLDSQAQALKDKLYGNSSLSIVLDETVSLLFQIKKHLQSEQKDIADFLSQLTDQLADLGVNAEGVSSTSKATTEKRNLLDESVSLQVKELQKSSKDATQLEPLKQLIHKRLATITQQIQEHHSQEKNERNKTEKVELQLESLTAKIKTMEKESRQLKDKLMAANERAIHDPLTGLPNRLAYDDRLKLELAHWKRYHTPVSLLVWDIDFFKKINDNFGHKAGDKTLILIGKLLSDHCRETDFVSRFGGEEFTMLLSNTDAQSALLAANKIRKVIEKTAFNSNGKKISITVSCGVTQFTDADSDSSAFDRADKALYAAKNNGRNQCLLG